MPLMIEEKLFYTKLLELNIRLIKQVHMMILVMVNVPIRVWSGSKISGIESTLPSNFGYRVELG